MDEGIMTIKIDRFDHLVLTVSDINASCEFYSRVMGMETVAFGKTGKGWFSGTRKSTFTNRETK